MLFTFCLAIAVLAVIGLAMLVHATVTAPYAVEDESGFHVISRQEGEKMMPAKAAARLPELAYSNR